MDPQTAEKKLQACIPHLTAAADGWAANGLVDAPLVIAVASQTRAAVITADGWSDAASACSREQAAAWLIDALEAPVDPEIVVACVSVLIGEEGRATHLQNVTTIRQRDQMPVLMMMVADADAMVATTTAVPRPTLH